MVWRRQPGCPGECADGRCH